MCFDVFFILMYKQNYTNIITIKYFIEICYEKIFNVSFIIYKYLVIGM